MMDRYTALIAHAMLKATKVRLYPTPEQAAFLNAQFGAVRFVYNKALHIISTQYKRHGTKFRAKKTSSRYWRWQRSPASITGSKILTRLPCNKPALTSIRLSRTSLTLSCLLAIRGSSASTASNQAITVPASSLVRVISNYQSSRRLKRVSTVTSPAR
ncbi:helix-turn-helix domain-containing protein [Vreelandella azerica]|uniref:helix-turn-helix domain-containing protein n=1 Tax=Vreelandella azerica TaxID=2732867 RepID=UPI002E284809|nr:helix-turn-helix domain-containing protein [Halomonas azerica]